MRAIVLVIVLGGFLAATLVTAGIAWFAMGDVEISFHGMLALVLGAVLTFALAAGLMFLVFFSSRRGYDDQ